jgi:hypothetical protein
MRQTVTIDIDPADVGSELIRRLAEIHLEGLRSTGWWGIQLPLDDPRVSRCIRMLADVGFTPWTQTFRPFVKGREYSITIERQYNESDLAPCRLLDLSTFDSADSYPARRNGHLRIYLPEKGDQTRFNAKADIQGTGESHHYTLIVSDRVRRLIEALNLREVGFKATFVIPPPKSEVDKRDEEAMLPWDGFGEPWWELTSSVILPPMSSRAFLVSAKGERVVDHFSDGCYLKDGIDNLDAITWPAEPKYLAKDVDAIGEFDVAHTFEWFGPKAPYLGRLVIVSSRFFQFCREHKLKTYFVPVRVHD